ncbi:DDC-like protein [Mya arenaria]|uniref:Aromatic-L-amino-acid decarboxylase n=1 Tax=Mya arenaria TaxID=6604 RepID=A0ABY7GA66_MYAAR|nr:DDC-like protein [Mya arenaria]
MDAEEFRKRGKEMIDYVADYLENVRDRRVFPEVSPGYLRELIPDHAPEEGEKWENVFKDIERVIMPGVTHWHSPQFHAYYPTANSYPAIVADILSDSIGCIGFTWMTHWQSPHFHAYYPARISYPATIADILSDSLGIIGFTWASSPACTELEVVVLDWLGKLLNLPEEFLHGSGGRGGGVIQSTASEATLVALLSARAREIFRYKQKNPDVEDGVIMSKFVAYSSDQAHSSVERAGLIACIKMRALPTDDNSALRGHALKEAIDRDRAQGFIPIFYAESFNFNPHKWLNVNFDCSSMVKDSTLLTEAFNVDPLYLKHENQGQMPDYRDVQLAHQFEDLVRSDERFEVVQKVVMGLVCFRLKDINADGRIHMVPSIVKEVYFLRFAICASRTTSDDVRFAWNVIKELASKM